MAPVDKICVPLINNCTTSTLQLEPLNFILMIFFFRLVFSILLCMSVLGSEDRDEGAGSRCKEPCCTSWHVFFYHCDWFTNVNTPHCHLDSHQVLPVTTQQHRLRTPSIKLPSTRLERHHFTVFFEGAANVYFTLPHRFQVDSTYST